MRKIYILLALLCVFIQSPSYAQVVAGGVEKNGAGKANKIIDSATNIPVPNARVTLPKERYVTVTDENGSFTLGAKVDGQTIMSVEKEGYRPFSMTIDEKIAAKPIVLGIEKSKSHDFVLDAEMFHLGDDNFSANSANSGEFKMKALGPFYSKTFKLTADVLSRTNYLVIGSIIGIDSMMARSLGQNKVVNSYASPPEVYFNGNKIAEIQLNGDGQRIKIPNNLIRSNSINEVTIKTGKNVMQTAYIDYDDIELMNISVQSQD